MEEILELLDNKRIEYKLIKHKRVYTIEKIKDINLEKNGLIPKNIFLRNAIGKVHFLVTYHPNNKVNIKKLDNDLGRFVFLSEVQKG